MQYITVFRSRLFMRLWWICEPCGRMVGHSKPNSNPVFGSFPEKACRQISQVLTLKMFFSKRNSVFQAPMLMEEILHRLGCRKPYELLGYRLHQLVGQISEPSTVCSLSRVAYGTLNNLGRSRQVVSITLTRGSWAQPTSFERRTWTASRCQPRQATNKSVNPGKGWV